MSSPIGFLPTRLYRAAKGFGMYGLDRLLRFFRPKGGLKRQERQVARESIKESLLQILRQTGGTIKDPVRNLVYFLDLNQSRIRRRHIHSELDQNLPSLGSELLDESLRQYRAQIFKALLVFAATARSAVEGLAHLFESEFWFYGQDNLETRLQCIFQVTEIREHMGIPGYVPGLQTAREDFGSAGFHERFNDHSTTQAGHFLTGLRLALEPAVVNQDVITPLGSAGSIREMISAGDPRAQKMDDATLAIYLSIGHEKFPDPFGLHSAIRLGSLDPRRVFLAQFKSATETDFEYFKEALTLLSGQLRPDFEAIEPVLNRIKIHDEKKRWGITWNKGNSMTDLRLTVAAFDMAQRITQGRIKSRMDAADYIRINLQS